MQNQRCPGDYLCSLQGLLGCFQCISSKVSIPFTGLLASNHLNCKNSLVTTFLSLSDEIFEPKSLKYIENSQILSVMLITGPLKVPIHGHDIFWYLNEHSLLQIDNH